MSITSPPDFSSDWLRHGLWAAIKKRWGSWVVGEQRWTYREILSLPAPALNQLLTQALDAEVPLMACWALEARLIQEAANPETCWPDVLEALAARGEPAALAGLTKLINYLSMPELLRLEDAYQNYLMGQHYGQLALRAKGSDKSALQSNKKTALIFLGKARELLDEASKSGKHLMFARNRITAGELALSASSAYEQIAYLQYKGARETPPSE